MREFIHNCSSHFPSGLSLSIFYVMLYIGMDYSQGYTVTQLTEALLYKLKGCRFDSRRSHWNLSLT